MDINPPQKIFTQLKKIKTKQKNAAVMIYGGVLFFRRVTAKKNPLPHPREIYFFFSFDYIKLVVVGSQ